MKTNRIYIALIFLFLIGITTSCDYLDIVPDERPTEEDAFKDKKAAERYLYSCYALMTIERQGVYLYQTGEIASDFEKAYLQGNHTPANIGEFHYWSRMYAGIKRCYTLIANVDQVPRLEEELKVLYKAEAKFLIAYYHFILLRAYGPVIIADQEYDIEFPAEKYPKRSSYDESVTWIANLFDEAYETMLTEQTTNYYGRATKIAAKAMKARMLLYAASPLFNGNAEFYSKEPLDPETSAPLMNLTYDANKWKVALDACKEAADLADGAGYRFYEGKASGDFPYPADSTEYSLRMAFIDKTNMEVIWADTRKETDYDLQNQGTPRDPKDDGKSWNGVSPTLATVQNFYTENGLPIEEDPAYFAKKEYYDLGEFDGETTCNLHLKREPRFYAWISFHNGWYEMQRDGAKRFRTKYRSDDPQGKGTMTRNFSLGGYLIKKGVTPAYDTQNGFKHYPWPLIRLAEVYLNLAEAAAEVNELELAKTYLNKVRKRAGILPVEDSWKGIATLDQKKLIEIIRKERTIELFLEGHYGWDMRRWKQADKVLNHNPQGLNTNGKTDTEFFQPATIEMAWKFKTPTHYLLPISDKEINANTKIVQNPGY